MSFFFFFNDTATTEIYTLSLHDALPICPRRRSRAARGAGRTDFARRSDRQKRAGASGRCCCRRSAGRGCRSSCRRSEEHTSELQSHSDLVCRLLLEKKKKK